MGITVLACVVMAAGQPAPPPDKKLESRVKVALALAGTAAAKSRPPEVAPPPRAVAPGVTVPPGAKGLPTYAEQYARAVQTNEVLVVWVGVPHRDCPPGVVCCQVPELPGAVTGTVLVGYPAGGQVLRAAVLPGTASDAAFKSAVELARAKLPQPMPAGPPVAAVWACWPGW